MGSEFILDSTAFYAGTPFAASEKFYTTHSVLNEVTRSKTLANRVEILTRSERLEAREPTKNSLIAAEASSKMKEVTKTLSDADLSVIALALDLAGEGREPIIITDDYAIQNVAKSLKIQYRALLFKGIRGAGSWFVFCPGCGRRYTREVPKECLRCGTKLKRRLRRSEESSG